MGQSTAHLSIERRIRKYIPLAEQSGKRFAFKHERYEPECQAEARFILTILVMEEPELFDKAEDEEIFLKIVIARRLRNYFRKKCSGEVVGVHPKHGSMVGEFKADPTNEITIVDEMESLFPGQTDLLALWRKGFDLQEMEFLSPRYKRVIKDMVQVKKMLERSRKAAERRRLEAAA